MSCKFKEQHAGCERPYCQVTNGECQFILSPYDDKCPILDAYKGLNANKKEEDDENM